MSKDTRIQEWLKEGPEEELIEDRQELIDIIEDVVDYYGIHIGDWDIEEAIKNTDKVEEAISLAYYDVCNWDEGLLPSEELFADKVYISLDNRKGL